MSKFKKIGVILILVGIGLPLVTFFWAGFDRWTVPPNLKEISIPTFINMTDVILRESGFALRKDKMKGEVYNDYLGVREEGYPDREIAEHIMKWKIVKEEPIEQYSDQNKGEMTRKEPKMGNSKIITDFEPISEVTEITTDFQPVTMVKEEGLIPPINWADYVEEIEEISIPYRYILLLGSILVLTGVGLVVLSNNKKKDQTNEIHNS